VPEPEEQSLESRVSKLEGEIRRLKDDVAVSRADAAAARVLAGGADRDVSELRTELRSHTQVLNALRETQIEHGAQLAEHGTQLAEHGAQLAELRSEMQRGFGTLHTGMSQITAQLEILIKRDDPTAG
jgi:chromosome segregation ATPase